MRLQDLPAEILIQCFEYLSGFLDSREDLEASRLTSKRLSEIVAPILIHSIRVHISLSSLGRLEAISQQSLIAKFVRTVEINLSFYDAYLAKDFSLFAKCRASDLSNEAEIFEGCTWSPISYRSEEEEEVEEEKEEIEIDYPKAREAEVEWTAVGNEDYDRENLTPCQMILQEAHQEYCRQFDDQELAKRDNGHLARIVVALRRFTGLRGIVLSDDPWERRLNTTTQEKSELEDVTSFSDTALKLRCLTASRWKGAFFGAETAPPPAQLIPDIFTALQQSSIFPSEFGISISAPNDLAVLQMSSNQLHCISHVLHKAVRLSFSVDSWTRQDPLAMDNARPYSEIQHLGNLTRAFFDVDSLESLELSFGDYPGYFEVPEISLGQVLPLRTRTWPHLQTLALQSIPFHQHEVRTLAERHSETVKKLDIFSPHLLSGSWVDSVEHLRNLDKLEQMNFQDPKGGEFGNYPGCSGDYLDREVAKYLLREGEDNPVEKRIAGWANYTR